MGFCCNRNATSNAHYTLYKKLRKKYGHITAIATSAGNSSTELYCLHVCQVRPNRDYCSQSWGAASPTTLYLLGTIQ